MRPEVAFAILRLDTVEAVDNPMTDSSVLVADRANLVSGSIREAMIVA